MAAIITLCFLLIFCCGLVRPGDVPFNLEGGRKLTCFGAERLFNEGKATDLFIGGLTRHRLLNSRMHRLGQFFLTICGSKELAGICGIGINQRHQIGTLIPKNSGLINQGVPR